MKKLLLALLLLLPFQTNAATTHHYGCADLTSTWNSCTDGVWTTTGASSKYLSDNNGVVLDMSVADTWYVSFVVTRSAGDNIRLRCTFTTGNPDNCPSVSVAATVVDEVVDATGMVNPVGLQIGNDIGPVNYYEGTVGSVCVSDTLGACAGGGAAPFRAFIATILWFL